MKKREEIPAEKEILSLIEEGNIFLSLFKRKICYFIFNILIYFNYLLILLY